MKFTSAFLLLILTPIAVRAQGDDVCPGAMLACNTCVTGTTVGFNNDHDCGEGHEGPDAVYQFTLAQPATITLIGEGDFEDADWTLSSTCDFASGECFDFLDPHLDPSCGSITHTDFGYLNYTGMLAAGTYYVWVDGYYSSSEGNYSLELLCDSSATPVPTPTATPVGPGDQCSNAIDISGLVNAGTYPQTTTGDLTSLLNDYALAGCVLDGALGADLVYSFTPDSTRQLAFNLCDPATALEDSVLYVRSGGDCPGDTEVACSDDDCAAPGDLLSAIACTEFTAGVTYYLFVDTFTGSAPGAFTLTIAACEVPQCEPGAAVNQPPEGPLDFWQAQISDMSSAENYLVFDNVLGFSGSVCNVTWWGIEADQTGPVACEKNVDVVLTFYADEMGVPGAVTGAQTITPVKTNTGLVYSDFPLYRFEAELMPCIDAVAGSWISVQAQSDPGQPDCWFLWMSSASGDAASYQWDGTELMLLDFDQSLCLSGTAYTPTPEPTITPNPTDTPVPPTGTPTFPAPTDTPVPPTATNSPVPPTVTPTPLPGTPTVTPTPLPGTPTVTPTPLPGTPTATPTPAPGTPTATPTTAPGSPTATMTPTPPVATPTPTPPVFCTALGVALEMPSHWFSPGDEVYLKALICNPGVLMTDIPLFVLLDVYGAYWFYPSWCAYPDECPDGDFQNMTALFTGFTEQSVIPSFIWPDTGADGANQLFFYAAMVDMGAGVLLGDLGTWEFAYGPDR